MRKEGSRRTRVKMDEEVKKGREDEGVKRKMKKEVGLEGGKRGSERGREGRWVKRWEKVREEAGGKEGR